MEFPDEGTLKLINLIQGGVGTMQGTAMTAFDNASNMHFELDNQSHKTIERAAAQQGLDFRTRTSDYQIHSFGHGEFYINWAAKKLEGLALAMKGVEDVDMLFATIESHTVSFPPPMHFGSRGAHLFFNFNVRLVDGEALTGSEIVRKQSDLFVCEGSRSHPPRRGKMCSLKPVPGRSPGR